MHKREKKKQRMQCAQYVIVWLDNHMAIVKLLAKGNGAWQCVLRTSLGQD